MKRKLGDSIRSKTPTAMVNEVLCKILAYNICCVIHEMHELGIKPDFGAGMPVASKVPVNLAF